MLTVEFSKKGREKGLRFRIRDNKILENSSYISIYYTLLTVYDWRPSFFTEKMSEMYSIRLIKNFSRVH